MSKTQPNDQDKSSQDDAIQDALEQQPKVTTEKPVSTGTSRPADEKPEPSKGLTTSDSVQDVATQEAGEKQWFDPNSGMVRCPKCRGTHVTRAYKGAMLIRQCLMPECLHVAEYG